MGANLWLGDQKDRHLRFARRPLNLVPAPCADKMSTILLGLHLPLFLSLAQIRDRRPLRYGERQSGYHCVTFVKYSQFTDSVLLHKSEGLRRRDIPVSRKSLVWRLQTAPARINCAKHLNPQVPGGITRKKIGRHCHAALCVDLILCVAVRCL